MNSDKFSISGRINSFKYGFRGVGVMLRTQHNAWLHALATLLVAITGFSLEISATEWCWIILAVVAVWSAEALNTAFEFLADVAQPDFHPLVEKAKDVAAGAVLIAAIGATIIATIIFLPKIV